MVVRERLCSVSGGVQFGFKKFTKKGNGSRGGFPVKFEGLMGKASRRKIQGKVRAEGP